MRDDGKDTSKQREDEGFWRSGSKLIIVRGKSTAMGKRHGLDLKQGRLWHRVYAATRHIPRGRVATYADIAYAVGRPRAWRHVGAIMAQNRDPKTPCHRVVRSDGRVGGFGFPGGTARKIQKLRAEGIRVTGDRIDLRRYRVPSPRSLVISH